MISTDRDFHYSGELVLKRSYLLDSKNQPKDDKTNWLFLEIGERQFSFIYKIENPLQASYNKPFNAIFSFIFIEDVKKFIQLNQTYNVLRGPELIGSIKIIAALD